MQLPKYVAFMCLYYITSTSGNESANTSLNTIVTKIDIFAYTKIV